MDLRQPLMEDDQGCKITIDRIQPLMKDKGGFQGVEVEPELIATHIGNSGCFHTLKPPLDERHL